MFNFIDTENGNKIDFWILTENPFDKSRFSRKYLDDFLGIKMFISSPEDTILVKLHWSKMCGGSKKQIIDALRVYEVQYESLDMKHLQERVEKLEVSEEWEKRREIKM
jgi:methionine synthase II (cobalamin-independent)